MTRKEPTPIFAHLPLIKGGPGGDSPPFSCGNKKLIQRGRCAFVFIGGMQPKKVRVDDQAWVCPKCGLPSARLKRVDHYLSLFFIPLIPIKRGEVFLECERCGKVFEETGGFRQSPFQPQPFPLCPKCGRQMKREFQFCPYCGQRIS